MVFMDKVFELDKTKVEVKPVRVARMCYGHPAFYNNSDPLDLDAIARDFINFVKRNMVTKEQIAKEQEAMTLKYHGMISRHYNDIFIGEPKKKKRARVRS